MLKDTSAYQGEASGLTAPDIYNEFTSGSNEDAFKADVSGLSTLTASDNIGINLDDVTGTLDAAEIGSAAFTNAKFGTACFNANQFADNSFTNTKFTTGFYAYVADTTHKLFIYGSNEDAFKADVSGLSTFDPATDKVTTVDSLAAYISYIANKYPVRDLINKKMAGQSLNDHPAVTNAQGVRS